MAIPDWASVFGSDSLWSIAANAGAIAGGLVLLYVGVVRFSRAFRAFAITSSYLRRRGVDVDRRSRQAFVRTLREHVDGSPHLAADAVAKVVRLHGAEHISPWSPEVTNFAEWLRRCAKPGAPSLAARLVAPDQATLADEFVRDVRALLSSFDHVTPVPESIATAAASNPDASRKFASALSGAAVLADAAVTRGGSLDQVLTWHDDTYRDEDQPWSSESTFEPKAEELPIDDHYRLGDYNGRLLELIAVTIAANPRDGATSFVLETRETCYRATEPPSHLACKRLEISSSDATTPRFDRRSSTTRLSRPLTPGSNDRILPVTSYVSLMTVAEAAHFPHVRGLSDAYDEPTVDVLVLCRRGAATRNGASTLSATAGGVVELSQGASTLDTDALGNPDVSGAALRELGEELGIGASELSMRPLPSSLRP